MSNTISIAASTTWGPERKHLAAVVAAIVGVVWTLSFAGMAQARPLAEDWDGPYAATLRALSAPSYGHPQGIEIEAVRAQNFRFDAPVARTDIEAVRAENFASETRWDGDYAAALRALSSPSYGHPQPAHDFTPVETQTPEIVDGVDLGLVTAAVMVGLIAVSLLALGINRRRAMSLP